MSAEAWTKLVLSVLAAYGYWFSLTPPSYPSEKDKLHIDGAFGFIAHNLSIASKVWVVSLLLSQALVLGSVIDPYIRQAPGLPNLCYASVPSTITILSPQFLFASLVVISMGLIRAWCYHSLGTLFTFQITVRRDHRLVTSGPYSYVRHPGYTALIFAIIGVNVINMDKQGWITQCGMMNTQLRWWIWTFWALCFFSIKSMITRGQIEDGHLKKAFPEEWEAYSRRVPRRFIPGVF